MPGASLFMCLLAFAQPSELPLTASSLEVRVVHACGDALPGVSVVLYHNDPNDGIDLSAWRRAGLPRKTDEKGRVLLRPSVAGEFVALAGLEGYPPSFSGPFTLSPDAPSNSLHTEEIVLGSASSPGTVVDPITDETDLRNGRLSLECHYESGSRSWKNVLLTGSGFAAVRKTAYCPEIDDFVQLSWSHSESGPQPVRTEARPTGDRREFYEFPGCSTAQPAIERGMDLREALGCERLEVTCWGNWD